MNQKIIAFIVTIVCAVLIELPDAVPLLDEAFLMFVIVKVWSWAGVDLLKFFSDKTSRKDDAEIVEIN